MVLAGLSCIVVAACGQDDGGPACTAGALEERLGAAGTGDTVSLGACRIVGSFRVPAGVRLVGEGAQVSTIAAVPGGVAVTLELGGAETSLADVTVESETGCAAVVAQGDGAGDVALEAVSIRAIRGIGLGVEAVRRLRLDALEIVGGIAPEDADATIPPLPPYTCGQADPATHGLVLVDVEDAQLADVRIAGFSAVGALLLRSTVTWSGGSVTDGVGTNLEVWGGQATLEDLVIERAHDGLAPIESYGAVFASGAGVVGRRLSVTEQDATGLFVEGAAVELEDLVASDNGFAGVWVQSAASFAIRGAATRIEANGFAGVALLDIDDAVIADATIAGTVEKLGLSGPTTDVRAADGLHLVRSAGSLSDLTLTDNPRVGLLVDLGGASTDALAIERVTVDASDDALGAVAQDGDLVAGWDSGVDRRGATAVNDAAFAEILAIARGVGPSCIPAPGELEVGGLASLLQ